MEIISSSKFQNLNVDFIENKSLYIENIDDIVFLFSKNRDYNGNGIYRIYFRNIC